MFHITETSRQKTSKKNRPTNIESKTMAHILEMKENMEWENAKIQDTQMTLYYWQKSAVTSNE